MDQPPNPDRVREGTLLDDVVLGERVVADEAAVFALSRNGPHPFQGQILGVVFARVLDVIPDAIDHGPQFVTDRLVVCDGVQLASPFDPPSSRSRCP